MKYLLDKISDISQSANRYNMSINIGNELKTYNKYISKGFFYNNIYLFYLLKKYDLYYKDLLIFR